MTGRLAELARRFQDVIDHITDKPFTWGQGDGTLSDQTDLQTALDGKADDNDARLTDAREWTATTVTKAEAETGTATARRAWTSLRVRQAIISYVNGIYADLKTDVRLAEITAKSSAWTFSMSEGDYYRYIGSGAVNATVPNNTSVAYPVGTVITIFQSGAGAVTANPASEVLVNGDRKTAGQNKAIQLVKVGMNVWDCIGGVA